MNILSRILIGMSASIILGIITPAIDYIIEKYSIQKICGSILRSLILGALLIPLLLWTSRETPRLSIIQKNLSVSYQNKEGLEIEGNFSGGKNKHIYLLVRQVSDTQKEVWTVTKEVVSINLGRSTWDARIYLQGMSRGVNPGDIYSIIGIMTEENLKNKAQIESIDLKKINGAITEELEIKIKEVSNE